MSFPSRGLVSTAGSMKTIFPWFRLTASSLQLALDVLVLLALRDAKLMLLVPVMASIRRQV